jgi:hypothetical protein
LSTPTITNKVVVDSGEGIVIALAHSAAYICRILHIRVTGNGHGVASGDSIAGIAVAHPAN